jgi:hypothetical protein
MTRRRAMSDRITALGPHQSFALNLACIPLRDAFGTPYLVGSVFTRRDPRDIDVRLILPDDDPTLSNPDRHRFLNHAVTAYLTALTGLPIDFQFQSQTEAKGQEGEGLRGALGIHFAPTTKEPR